MALDIAGLASSFSSATPFGAGAKVASDLISQSTPSGISGAASTGGAVSRGDFIVGGGGRNSDASQIIMYGLLALGAVVAIFLLRRK